MSYWICSSFVLVLYVYGCFGKSLHCPPHCTGRRSPQLDQCSGCSAGYYPSRASAFCRCERCYNNCITCKHYNLCRSCKTGYFGRSCRNECSAGCKNSICEFITGHCYCSKNYIGQTCTDCVTGRYGTSCQLECNKGCFGDTCNRTTGSCACKQFFQGPKCSECVSGKYGENCTNNCSIGCVNGVCNHVTGRCNCKLNYSGMKCDSCLNTLKMDVHNECSTTCPSNCIRCDSSLKCTVCKSGFYGSSCQYNCTETCRNGTCKQVTGSRMLTVSCLVNKTTDDTSDASINHQNFVMTVLLCIAFNAL